MMAHVAEASESNGRVLLLLEHGGHERVHAAETASRFAAAFNAEIEAVAMNTDAIARAKAVPVAAIAAGPAAAAAELLDRAGVHHEILHDRQLRTVGAAARRFGVPWFHTAVSGGVIDQLDVLCLSRGPWNVVVLSAPVSEETAVMASDIFANVSGATGIVAVPPRCLHPEGPIALVVEDGERLPAMLRAASRLKGLCGRVHLLLAADTRKDMDELEAHVRLMTANHHGLLIERPTPLMGVPGALDEALRGLKTSFVVARFAGALLPTGQSMARTVTLSGAPFLLVR